MADPHGETRSGEGEDVAPDPDFVVLPRGALLEFFGAVALPPWTDEKGRTIGGRIDCAPIAQRISEWIDSHDLSDLYLTHFGGPTGDDR